jgi:hypothetical protein
MSFLSPLFLFGALAAAVPVALHLFHRRTEPVVPFAAMRYLRRTPVDDSRWRRIKELLLLALRVAAALLLAFAFARPFLPQAAGALDRAATLVMIDTSASLSAPGQLDRLRAIATDVIRSAPVGQSVGVVTFSQGADVIAPLSDDRAGALAAVSRLNLGAGATRYRSGFARAAEQIGSRPGRIVVVTDLQQSGWDAAGEGILPERVDVEIRPVPAPAGNLAVSALAVDAGDAVATIQSYAAGEVTTQVAFAIDGHTIGTTPVTVPARGAMDVRLPLGGPHSGALSAAVVDRDGYVADNTRFTLLDTNAAPSVLALSASGRDEEVFYLSRALSIGSDADAFRFRAIGSPAFSDLKPEDLGAVDVLAILGTRGLDQRGRDLVAAYVRRGGGLLVSAGPQVDPVVVGRVLNGTTHSVMATRNAAPLGFAPDDSRHPVFRVFGGVGTLSSVSCTRSVLLTPGDGAEVIARYSDGSPALVEEQIGDGRVLMFGSDFNHEWNDFPVQPAFVPFVHEALRYLASPRLMHREYLVGDLPGNMQPGIVRLPGNPATQRVAVNVDPREFDPAALTPDAFRAAVSTLRQASALREAQAATEQADRQRLWQLALAVMVVGLVAEGALGRRLG